MPPDERRFAQVILDNVRSRLALLRGMKFLVAVASVVVLLPIGLWAHYRLTHIISRNAVVRGSITHVGAQLSGVVTSVEVEAGQRVHAGQVLARFEDFQLQANVKRAHARLEQAARALEVERLAIEQEGRELAGEVTEAAARTAAAGAQVDAARNEADDARARHAQRRSLVEAGAIAAEELRIAETRLRTAAAQESSAHAGRKAAEAAERLAEIESQGLAVRERNLVVLRAEVEGYRAELAIAEAELRAARIVAPADGWVVRRIAEPGVAVVVGQPIVALWIGSEVWVEAWINEEDLAGVAVGNRARVTVKPYPRRVLSGAVETVGVSTDMELPDIAVPQPRSTRMRATPVVCVRIRLADAGGLFPGLSAVVAIRRAVSGALAAPSPAPAGADTTDRR
jgi:membrane fusion protein (multidrug efflux system)